MPTTLRTKVVRIPSGTALATQVQQADGTFATATLLMDGMVLVGILMPSGWTAAALTFRAGLTGEATPSDVYDTSGSEMTFQAAASRFISVEPRFLAGIEYLQVRSGTTGSPVNQGADRDITLFFREFD